MASQIPAALVRLSAPLTFTARAEASASIAPAQKAVTFAANTEVHINPAATKAENHFILKSGGKETFISKTAGELIIQTAQAAAQPAGHVDRANAQILEAASDIQPQLLTELESAA